MSGAAELAGLPATVEFGCQLMRRSVAISGIDGLYDEHYRSFGCPAHIYKPQTIKGLIDRLSWRPAIDILIRSTATNPSDIEGKHQLALMLEHLGQIEHAVALRTEIAHIDPDWFQNNISIGRLMELSRPIEAARKYYANTCASASSHNLALARSVAINGPQILGKITVAQLRAEIEAALESPPDDILRQLAIGFICMSNSDIDGARQNFAAACVHANKIGNNPANKTVINCDEWSLAYARAYLLGLLPPGKTAVPMFATIDPNKLALTCAAQQRSEGANISVLSAFEGAIDRILPQPPSLNHYLYHGYRIAHLAGSYYAIPEEVTEFFFLNGRAYRLVPSYNERISGGRDVISRSASPELRRLLKCVFFKVKVIAFGILNRIPGGHYLARKFGRLAIQLYMRRYEIRGVLVDSEYATLQQSVDRMRTLGPDGSHRVSQAA
jgi:hypothetical protein